VRRWLGRPRGVTLIELLIVLMILSLILTAAVKTWDVTLERGRFESTRKKLDQLATAVTGDPDYIVAGQRADFGFVGDVGRIPRNIAELAVNPYPGLPDSVNQWRGPYVRATFGEAPETYRTDGWGDTITFNPDSMFMRSYGGKGLADRTAWMTRSLGFRRDELEHDLVSGLVVDERGMTPPDNDSLLNSLHVVLVYPFEGELRADTLKGPVSLSNGQFRFENIPVGRRQLEAFYVKPPDSILGRTTTQITVYPRSGARDVRARVNLDWNDYPF